MQKFSLLKVLLSIVILFLVTLLITSWDIQWDLTSDKRYTINPLAKEMIKIAKEPIVITIYLKGEIPASFRNYQAYIDYYTSELRRYDQNVRVEYRNPAEGEDAVEFRQFLSSRGIEPLRRRVSTEEEVSLNLLYPYLSIHNSEEIVFVNLLEPQIPGSGEEESLLQSQLAFEGKFLRGLRQLTLVRKPEVHVIGYRTTLLAEGFNRDTKLGGFRFFPSNAEALLDRRDSLDAVIAVVKKEDLDRDELLAIDVLAGMSIPILWLVDKFDTTIDSLRETGSHLGMAREFQVEDYLFRCGIKIRPELIMDLQSSRIPQVVNDGSSTPQTKMMKYPYHPLIVTNANTPAAATLSSPLPTFFTAPIEVLEYPKSMIKEVLIETSPYTRLSIAPVLLDFGMMQVVPDPEDYRGGSKTIGVHVRGRIKPFFTNRLTKEDKAFLNSRNINYSLDSQYIDQIVISDADFAMPAAGTNGGVFPIGYNPVERQMYEANTQFLGNLLESLINGNDILLLNKKRSDIAILDTPRYEQKAGFYNMILLGFPMILLLITYVAYHWIRKKMYAS